MKLVAQRQPSDHMKPALGDARIAKMWTEIERRERSPRVAPRSRRFAALLVAASFVAVIVFLVVRLRTNTPSPASLANLVVESGATGQTISLPDGSALHVGPATRLELLKATAAEVRLHLEHGSVTCDVTHREGRPFVVEAGHREVEVKGTRFEVEVKPAAEGPWVRVEVERGTVEVRDTESPARATLQAGDTWTNHPPAPVPSPPSPSSEATEPMPSPPPSSVASSPPPSRENAQMLFERADGAMLAGRQADAAVDLAELMRRYPNDARAGLAAHQLGRIRLRLHERPELAIEAFNFAIEHADGTFREDAEVGRVEATERLGDAALCKRRRDAFLAQHPESQQRLRVARFCGEP